MGVLAVRAPTIGGRHIHGNLILGGSHIKRERTSPSLELSGPQKYVE